MQSGDTRNILRNMLGALKIIVYKCRQRRQYCYQEGTRNPPRWIINFFLRARGTCLSTTVLSWRLNLRNFRFLHSESFTLPLKTFSAHSLILYNSSLSVFALLLCVILDGRLSEHAGYDSWTVSVSLFIGAYTAGGPSSGKTLVRNLNLSSVSCAKSRMKYPCGRSVAFRNDLYWL